MRISSSPFTWLVTTLCFLLLACGLLFYSTTTSNATPSQYPTSYCIDCVSYLLHINKLFSGTVGVDENVSFFKYALDIACRGNLLVTGRCPKFRREFLNDMRRYMREIRDPYEACRSIKACG